MNSTYEQAKSGIKLCSTPKPKQAMTKVLIDLAMEHKYEHINKEEILSN